MSESNTYYMCRHPVDMRNGIDGLSDAHTLAEWINK